MRCAAKFRGARQLHVEHARRTDAGQRLAEHGGGHAAAGQEALAAARGLGRQSRPAQQEQDGGEDRRELAVRRTHRRLQCVEPLRRGAQRAPAQPARASSLRPGNTALRIAASNTRAGSASGVSLLTTTRLTTKFCGARHLAKIGQHVRLAGAEAAGDAQPARRRAFRPDRAQQLVERMLDAGLGGAHQADGRAVGHAGAQSLDCGAGFQVHALTVTSGASGFCRSPGRTSGQIRISSAL